MNNLSYQMNSEAFLIRQEILRLTREYSRRVHAPFRPAADPDRQPWRSGSTIPYAGRVFTEDEVEAVETNEWLATEIADLPEREQIVLSLYYNDEMNLKEIGAIIGVSESRVSQILTKVVGKLRDRVAF